MAKVCIMTLRAGGPEEFVLRNTKSRQYNSTPISNQYNTCIAPGL